MPFLAAATSAARETLVARAANLLAQSLLGARRVLRRDHGGHRPRRQFCRFPIDRLEATL
jgi:hypothetical protein